MKKNNRFVCFALLGAMSLGGAISAFAHSPFSQLKADGIRSATVEGAQDMISANIPQFMTTNDSYFYFGMLPNDLEVTEAGNARYKGADLITLTTAGGEVSLHHANIAKQSPKENSLLQYYDRYYLQFDNWSGDSYTVNIGDTITFNAGTYLRDNGDSLTFENPVSFTRTEDGYFVNGTNQETVEINNDNININVADCTHDAETVYLSFTAEDFGHITINGGWDYNRNRGYNFTNGKVISSTGEETTIEINFERISEVKGAFIFATWGNNYYDFQEGDSIVLSGTQRLKDSYDILIDYDLTIHFGEDGAIYTEGHAPVPVPKITLDYTSSTTFTNGQSNYLDDGETPNGKAFYVDVGEFLPEDVIKENEWTTQAWGENDIKITSIDGTVQYTNSIVVKLNDHRYCLEFNDWSHNNFDFQTRDKVEVDTNSVMTYEGTIYTIKLRLTVYYASSLDKVDPWVASSEIEGVNNVLSLISNIGTVDGSDECHNKILAAREAYSMLNGKQTALILDEELAVLIDAEARYAEIKIQEAVDNVNNLIDGIGEVVYTEECHNKILAARAAYEALGENKSLITEEKVAILIAAEEAYQALSDVEEAAEVSRLINAIGTVDASYECGQRINAARIAYNNLTENGKSLVSAEDLRKLEDAEALYQELKNQEYVSEVVAAINAIGEVDGSAASKAKITAARIAYDNLDASYKRYVDAETLKILTDAESAFAAALNKGKEDAKATLDAFLSSLDMNEYSAGNQARISAIIKAGKEAIDSQDVTDGLNAIIENCKTQVNAIEKEGGSSSSSDTHTQGGCGGSIVATTAIVSAIALSGLIFVAIRRKEK